MKRNNRRLSRCFLPTDPLDQNGGQRVGPLPGLERVQRDAEHRQDPEAPGRTLLLQGRKRSGLARHQVHQGGCLL